MKVFLKIAIVNIVILCTILASCQNNNIENVKPKMTNGANSHDTICGEVGILNFYSENENPYKIEQPYTFIINKYLDLANNYFSTVTPPYYIINPVTYDKEATFLEYYDTNNESCEMDDLNSTDLDSYFNYLYEMMYDEINQMSIIQDYAEVAQTLSETEDGAYMEIDDDDPTISIGGVPYNKLYLLYAYENQILLPFEMENEHIDEDESLAPASIDDFSDDTDAEENSSRINPRRVLKKQWVASWPRKIRYRNYKNKCPNLSRMQTCMEEWCTADNNYIYFTQIVDNGWNRFTWGIGCNYHLCLALETDPNCSGTASIGCAPWAIIKLSETATEGSYLHELGHTLGLLHEFQRADRDLYVKVYYDRIIPGYKSNFWKYNTIYALPMGYFDFNSIMMYGAYAFSKPDSGQTIERLNAYPYYVRSNVLSDDDKTCIRIIYHP